MLVYLLLGIITYFVLESKDSDNPLTALKTSIEARKFFVICLLLFPVVWILLLAPSGDEDDSKPS